jgi:hypothetical protein
MGGDLWRNQLWYTRSLAVGVAQRSRVPIAKGVKFVEKNVCADEVAMKEPIDHSFQGTPVTIIDGQSVWASIS